MTDKPKSMIDAVARALCLSDPDSMRGRIKSEESPEGLFRVWSDDDDMIPAWQQTGNVESAKRAIKAMREPTKEMICVGNDISEDAGDIWEPSEGISYGGPSCGLEVWQAMIDEALKDG